MVDCDCCCLCKLDLIGDKMSTTASIKQFVRKVIPLKILVACFNLLVIVKARKRGIVIARDGVSYRIRKNRQELRLSKRHSLYLGDTVENFDTYYSGVTPITIGEIDMVDYSTPRWHQVIGFDDFPIYFPAHAEPVVMTNQYIEFAEFKPGAIALDLGAYSGLTSILFDKAIPGDGRVIALEADPGNVVACEKNLALYERFSGRKIELVKAAIWKDDKGVSFSSESTMGSAVVDVVGSERGKNVTVPSLTLLQVVQHLNLPHIDFVKCDIEGGETEIFNCTEFFAQYRPRIMIECHMVNSGSTSAAPACIEALTAFGYQCTLVEQIGYPLPLLACVP